VAVVDIENHQSLAGSALGLRRVGRRNIQQPPNGIILGKGGIRCQQEAREWENGRLGQRKKSYAMDMTQIEDFDDVKIPGSAIWRSSHGGAQRQGSLSLAIRWGQDA
jgi:hypothetical protein